MACHVLRLTSESECGACSRAVPAGYAVITSQIEPPLYVVVCGDCSPDLDGARVALKLVESVGAARSGR